MGGAVSAGRNNEELIDNLFHANLIPLPEIERAFRLVDRAYYFPEPYQAIAYRDIAWKHRIYHISAPCIYAEVLNALDLNYGHSFLNIGSGTGYFSTIAGILIGHNGLNNGIEICPQLVEFSKQNVQKFCDNILNNYNIPIDVKTDQKQEAKAIGIHQNASQLIKPSLESNNTSQNCQHLHNDNRLDFQMIKSNEMNSLIDFCYPKFITADVTYLFKMLKSSNTSFQGASNNNLQNMESHGLIAYDRVYCGASCTPGSYWAQQLKHLIKVNGILVVPLNDQEGEDIEGQNIENSQDFLSLSPTVECGCTVAGYYRQRSILNGIIEELPLPKLLRRQLGTL